MFGVAVVDVICDMLSHMSMFKERGTALVFLNEARSWALVTLRSIGEFYNPFFG